jgi:hypothetical protein
MLRELLEKLDGLQSRIRRGRTVNVNDRETKDEAIAVASAYFGQCRKVLARGIGEDERLLSHDEKWQELVRFAHGNNARRSYLNHIKTIRKELAEFNITYLSHLSEQSPNNTGLSDLTPAEQMIIKTLELSIPSAAASYRQALLDLRGAERLSYRGTASELRESLRETLDHLAPDDDVLSQPGFALEPSQTKPTMKQKVQYILGVRGRTKTKRMVVEKSIELVDTLAGEITRAVYNQASLAVHVETSRTEVMKIKRYVDTIFFDLLEISEG